MAEQHEKALVPQIRFTGFTDPWEQRKLGELFEESDERASDREILSVSVANGIYPASESDRETNPGASLANYKIVHFGDVVYNSMRMWQGAVDASRYDGIVSPAYVVARPNSEVYARFFARLLRQPMLLKQYQQVSQGNSKDTQVLKFDDFASIGISMPVSENEQRQIGGFFDRLDSLITLHQRKYDKLCVLKKSMLDKMFPKGGSLYPEIRFAGFTNPWEQRKLGEVAHFINGRAYSQNELLSSGKYPVLRVGNFYTNDSWYYSNLELEDKNYAYEGDLLYTWSATFGPHIWHGNKVIYHYHIWKVQLEAAFEKLFAFQLLERDKERILSDKNGSTMVHITKIGIENTSVLMPCSVIEQRQIGAFLDRLDSLITLHQRKLELLRNIKKSMLDKMFV